LALGEVGVGEFDAGRGLAPLPAPNPAANTIKNTPDDKNLNFFTLAPLIAGL
jgi:hypothetical protein